MQQGGLQGGVRAVAEVKDWVTKWEGDHQVKVCVAYRHGQRTQAELKVSYRHGESINTGRSLWAGMHGEEREQGTGGNTLGEVIRVVEGAQKRGVCRVDDRYGWV